jgi:hypothetical protein
MHLVPGTLLLFLLNVLDALLTLFWVRTGVAPEGTHFMAALLDTGDLAFLVAKIGWGLLTALVLLKWGHKSLAKYGLSFALTVYFCVMAVHFFTGMFALGWFPDEIAEEFRILSQAAVALLM